jgi:hypothetical protein
MEQKKTIFDALFAKAEERRQMIESGEIPVSPLMKKLMAGKEVPLTPKVGATNNMMEQLKAAAKKRNDELAPARASLFKNMKEDMENMKKVHMKMVEQMQLNKLKKEEE